MLNDPVWISLGTVHPLLYVWNHRVHVKSDLPPKARAQTSNLYEVTASFVFQSFKLVVPLFVWCSASVMLPDSSKQILHGWRDWKTPVAMLCISQTKRSWKFWPRRGSDWSPIEVLALCPCVSFGLRWQGQELCPIWWPINHKRFSWRLPSRIIFFSFPSCLEYFSELLF